MFYHHRLLLVSSGSREELTVNSSLLLDCDLNLWCLEAAYKALWYPWTASFAPREAMKYLPWSVYHGTQRFSWMPLQNIHATVFIPASMSKHLVSASFILKSRVYEQHPEGCLGHLIFIFYHYTQCFWINTNLHSDPKSSWTAVLQVFWKSLNFFLGFLVQ